MSNKRTYRCLAEFLREILPGYYEKWLKDRRPPWSPWKAT